MTNEEFEQALAAAQNGDADAMLAVSNAYRKGIGTAENLELAIFWQEKAAAFGNAEAQAELAADFKERLAEAEGGDADSQMLVGFDYLNGTGTEMDFNQAIFWFKKLLQNNANLMMQIGFKGIQSIIETMLPARNFRELMEGAQKGNVNFQYGLGFAYLKGFGTDADPNQAVFWFQKAATQGHTGAGQTLSQVQAVLAVGGGNFDSILPKKNSKGMASKHPILWSLIGAAVVSYLATFLDKGWLHSLAIFYNVSCIFYIPIQIIGLIVGLVGGIGLAIGSKGRGAAKATMVLGVLYVLLAIPTIGLSIHYIKGRKTENPVSIVLQNPFEAARKRIFSGKKAAEPVEIPVVTATVTGSAANVRSAPDSSKNNVIVQMKNGGVLVVTGPAEKGWLPVEVDGKSGYVSADLVKINDQ